MSQGLQKIRSMYNVQRQKENEWRELIPTTDKRDPCEFCGKPGDCFLIMGHAVHARCIQKAVYDPKYGTAATYNDVSFGP